MSDLKNDIIRKLSSKKTDDIVFSEVTEQNPTEILGSDFTSSVMKRVRSIKKPSPIIRLTRIALPVAACAAAIAIFVTVGMRNEAGVLTPDGINTVDGSIRHETDSPSYGHGDPSENPSDIAVEDYLPQEGSNEELDFTADESTDNSVPTEPEATASTAKDHEKEESDTDKNKALYAMNVAGAKSLVTTFSAGKESGSSEETGNIVIKTSEAYYGKTIFGYELCLSVEGTEYEVIVTSEKEISRAELMSQIRDYISSLDSAMNSENGEYNWKIEIISDDLPSVIESNTRIKITRTK